MIIMRERKKNVHSRKQLAKRTRNGKYENRKPKERFHEINDKIQSVSAAATNVNNNCES